MKRRIVSLLMCLVMVLSLLPTEVWAEVLPEQDTAQQITAENGGQEDSKESAANTAAPQSGENGVSVQAGAVAEVDIYGEVTTYADIFEAFAATKWQGDATVKLLQNVTLDDADDSGIVLQYQTVTLDLNGKTISQKSGISVSSLNSAVFSVYDSAELTVMDSKGGGKIVQPNGCPAVTVWKSVLEGTLTVNGGTIENTSTEGHTNILGTPNCAVYAKQGVVTINGGALTGQKIGLGAYEATLTITGGQFHGESSNALLVGDSTVSLSGGTYTTKENDNHSIWCTSSEVEKLLAVGYGFVDEKGNEAETTEPNEWGSGTVGKVIVKKTADTVPYIDANGNLQSCKTYTEVNEDIEGLDSGWYAVKTPVSLEGFIVNSDQTVNLILCDGVSLTGSGAFINRNGTLNIYGQSAGTGTLSLTNSDGSSAIGPFSGSATLNIYGGTIRAEATEADAAAIGLGSRDGGTTMAINIYGGTVTAKASAGTAAIGKSKNVNGTVIVKIATGLKCVKTDDRSTACAYDNTDGTSVTISKCTAHQWEYKNNTGNTHDMLCALCGTGKTGVAHTAKSYQQLSDANSHIAVCECGKEYSEACDIAYSANDDGKTHTAKCGECGKAGAAANHDFRALKTATDPVTSKEYPYYECMSCNAMLKATYNGAPYTSLQMALDAAKKDGGGTVKAETYVTERITVTGGDVTIDLNGNVWYVQTAPCVPLTVDGGKVTLQNGVLRGGYVSTTGNAAVVNSGSLTLAEGFVAQGTGATAVKVTGGDLILNENVVLSGGLEVPADKTLADYLPDKTVFKTGQYDADENRYYEGENYVAGVFTIHTYTSDMQVQSHTEHLYMNGVCGCGAECPHESWQDGQCAACGYVCTHDGVNADANCSTCGAAIVAKVEVSGKTTYHVDMTAALEAAKDNGTLTVIAKEKTLKLPDKNGYPVLYAEGTLTLDLNGHTLSGGGLMVGGYVGVSTRTGNLTVIDSIGGGKITGDEYGLKVQPGAKVKFDGAACSKLAVYSQRYQPAEIKFAGGVIHEITTLSDATCADLLAEGYCFYSYDETTAKVGDAIKLATLDGQTKVTTPLAVGKCSHDQADDDGKCVYCGAQLAVRDSNGVIYGSLTEAISAALSDSSIKWVQLDANLTESVVFDAEGKSVTVKMNGKTLTSADGVPLTVKNGTLTIADAANITQTGATNSASDCAISVTGGELIFAGDLTALGGSSTDSASPAIAVTGGKVTFAGKVTATGGLQGVRGNAMTCKPAVYATGGELDFKGDLDLNGGLTITGSAKLTNGLSKGVFRAKYDEESVSADRVSVEGSANYKYLGALLADGYAFVKTDDQTEFPCTSTSMRSWSGNVTIMAHQHTWGPGSGDLFWCTVCHLICDHPGGFATGKCEVCGKPCPHTNLDDTGSEFRCRACDQIMVAKIMTKNNEGYDLTNYYANLVDALKAVKNNETITLLSDINNNGKYAILTGDNMTATLDLNGKTITGGGIQVGYEDGNDQTSSRLNITGSGSFMTSGNLSVGYKATVDLSGWTGGTISHVVVSNDETTKVDGKLIVGENAGTIENLAFYNRRTASISSELSGGTYGSIEFTISDYKVSVTYGDMLAEGYAFQYVDSGEYVAYGKKALYSDYDSRSINNVKVVECPHPESAVTDATGNCAYCNTAFEAKKTDKDGTTTYIKALNSTDFESGSVILLRDVSKGILYCRATATLDLNGHSLMASAFTITGTCTLKDSNPKANSIQSINIGTGRDAEAGSLIIKPGTNVPVGKLTVCGSRNTKLAGGTFDSITIDAAAKSGYWKIDSAADLLADGYAYTTLQGVVNGYQDTLTEVRVVEHKHTFNSDYECACGLTCAHETYNSTTGRCTVCGRQMAASISVNGVSGHQYYATFDEALEALKDNDNKTLKLFDDCQYGNTALNSNNLKYTTLTIDLNGHELYGADTSSKLIQVIDGAKLIIKDTSAAKNGSVDNVQITLGNSSSGKLTLESGAIDTLQVAPDSDVTLKLGGKVRYLTTGGDLRYAFPIAALFFSGSGLVDEDGNWVDLGSTSVGRAASNGYYTVKSVEGLWQVSPSKSGEIPAGRRTLPFDVQLTSFWGFGDVTQVKFQWYRADTSRDVLASDTAAIDSNSCVTYDKTTEGSGNGWTDLTTGKTAKLVCVATGLDAAGNTQWCVSAETYELTIGKGDLSDATITFPDGNVSVFDPANELTNARGITVTHNGKTLTEGKDYTVSGNTADQVGDHQLTITAVEGSDYVGEKSAEWTVRPYQLAPAVGDAVKQYDGTTDLPESASITLVGADPDDSANYGKTLPATVDFAVTNARYDSADADTEEKTISFTVNLKDKNFIFTDGTTGGKFTVKGSETTSTFKINKADAPKMTVASALVVTNDQAGTYELTLPDLPALKSPCEYGDVSYSVNGDALVSIYRDAVTELKVVQESGQYKLKLTIDAVNTTDAGSAGTVRVKVATANYQDITMTVSVKARNKLMPEGSPTLTPNAITYGQTVGAIQLSGGMKADGMTVTGTFTWDAPNAKPTKAGSYDAAWTFTPTDTAEYQVVHGSTTITVNRAPLTGVSVRQATALTYNGEPQRATVTTTGKTVDGTPVVFRYSTKSDDGFTKEVPQFTNAGTYAVYYQASDEDQNHVVSTGSFTVTIAARNISEADIVLGDKLTYNGQKQTQSIKSVTVDGLSVTYDVAGHKNTEAGKYTLTVTGTDNFTGTATAKYTIAAKNIGNADIKLGDALTYNGAEQTQTVTSVTVDGLTVTYTVSGEKATKAGEYTLTVTGTDNFTGTATAKYTIARKDISNAEIVLGEELTYNGAEQTQAITSVTVDGLDVTYAVSGNKQTDAGDYKLTITGNGNFTGTATADYTIAVKNITDAQITLGDKLTYNGKEQTQSIASVTVDDLDVTYTVTGDKAINAGDYTLTITANGNFAGTLTADYTVARKDIQDAVVDVESPVYTGKIQTPKINGVTVDDMTLVEGTDYTALTRDAVSAGSYAMKLIGMGNFTGTADRTFTILKAEALTVEPIRVDVTNDYAASHTVDLRAALNGVLPEGCSFGAVNYGSLSIISDPSGYCGNTAVSSKGVLTLSVTQVSSDTEGLVATVEIPVETANYRQMTVTVELYAVNKLIPTGEPTPSKTTLNYGDALSSIRLRGTMRSGGVNVPGTFGWAEPDLRPAAGEYKATWVFTPNDSRYATVTGTITITVKEPSQPTYKVGGIVKGFRIADNEELAPISGAVVTICKGLAVLGGQKLTDENGRFDLDGVLPGVYNVVVEYQGKTVTTKVELTDHDVELKVLLPEEDVNSELEIRNAGSLIRDAVVGGLDNEASLRFTEDGTLDGGSVLVSMEIREQPVDKSNEVQNAIRNAVKTRNLEFVDLTLTLVKNGVETTLPESSTVLEIILSYDTSKKLVIARQEADENGELIVKELTESETGAEGTYYIDKANKRIHLFVSQLSTYAIGYYGTPHSGGGSGSTDASGTTADGVKSANTGDIGLLPYAVMALSACTGAAVLRFRRKRED